MLLYIQLMHLVLMQLMFSNNWHLLPEQSCHSAKLSLQVNLCQKLLFLHQITHNMTADCSLFMKIVNSEHVVYTYCCFCFEIQNNCGTQHVLLMLRASEKDLPVLSFSSRGSSKNAFLTFLVRF